MGLLSDHHAHDARYRCPALSKAVPLLPALVLAAASPAPSADLALQVSFRAADGVVLLSVAPDPARYFTVQASRDLVAFHPLAMALGEAPPVWQYPVPSGPDAGFFRLRAVHLHAPEDTDGDGIDDVHELRLAPALNPLDPGDAVRDPDGDGNTFLQEYRARYHYGTNALQVFSREASVFNFGSAMAALEAISREVALYNFGSPPARVEAVSQEVSVYNGELAPRSALQQAISREVTAYNFGSPPARVEAISAEVSIYNGQTPPRSNLAEAYSREVSVFNLGSPTASLEAISRELTVLNFRDPQGP